MTVLIVQERRDKMNRYRKLAIVVGALFITADIFGVVGNLAFRKPILDSADYLINASAHGNQLILGALFTLIGGLACAGIAIGLYPVLRRHNEGLALGAVGFRLIEAMLYALVAAVVLSVLTLSQEYVKTGAPGASSFQASGASLLAVGDWAGQLSVIAFTLGALMYYYVFSQSNLIPRWLSVWGLVAAASSLAAALLSIFGLIAPLAPVFLIMQAPIAFQEIVLAVWLIARGFNTNAVASRSPKTGLEETEWALSR